jgi:hypothetical protein
MRQWKVEGYCRVLSRQNPLYIAQEKRVIHVRDMCVGNAIGKYATVRDGEFIRSRFASLPMLAWLSLWIITNWRFCFFFQGGSVDAD